ncbi:MAG: AMP-binding protein [Desulfobacteraceae bacterium 4572_130]|nr:MAG: AMP-binding protein [Desulfobacteraceae bacterium 4572_130]
MQIPEIEIGKTTISDLVDILANNFGENKALTYNSYGINNNFKEFRDICDDVAKGLIGLGIEKGENIAVWANNVPEWVYTQYGSARAGAVLVTVNTSYKSFELEYLMKQSDSTTLIMIGGVREPDEYKKVVKELYPEIDNAAPGNIKCEKLPKLKNIIYIGKDDMKGALSWNDLLEAGRKVSDKELQQRKSTLKPEDVINMQYTSGTTGFPKGVMLSHTNLIGNAKSMAECMKLSPKDVMCIPVPFFHCFGCVIGTLCCMVSGTTMAPVVAFEPQDVMQTIDKAKASVILGVPTMFIAELEEMDKTNYDTSNLRTGVMAGSPCPIEVMKSVVNKMGASEMTIVYGQTEASPGITQTRAEDSLELRVTTVGRALPGVEVKIIDPITGKELESGEQGELCSRGYNTMKGYYKMEEATKGAVDSDNWLHTGDLAIMDGNGYCKITGRIKDMIIRGGENIYPREIEEFLYTNDKIKDVQVVGVPSKKYGEEVAAFIQLKPEIKASEQEISDFCQNKIAFHKIPKFFFFVEEYPTTASGKIQKYKLREQVTASLNRQEDADIETA